MSQFKKLLNKKGGEIMICKIEIKINQGYEVICVPAYDSELWQLP